MEVSTGNWADGSAKRVDAGAEHLRPSRLEVTPPGEGAPVDAARRLLPFELVGQAPGPAGAFAAPAGEVHGPVPVDLHDGEIQIFQIGVDETEAPVWPPRQAPAARGLAARAALVALEGGRVRVTPRATRSFRNARYSRFRTG
jgi:hypothetical protein